jgi:hypothetical protein
VAGVEMQTLPIATLPVRALRVLADRAESNENVDVEA